MRVVLTSRSRFFVPFFWVHHEEGSYRYGDDRKHEYNWEHVHCQSSLLGWNDARSEHGAKRKGCQNTRAGTTDSPLAP